MSYSRIIKILRIPRMTDRYESNLVGPGEQVFLEEESQSKKSKVASFCSDMTTDIGYRYCHWMIV